MEEFFDELKERAFELSTQFKLKEKYDKAKPVIKNLRLEALFTKQTLIFVGIIIVALLLIPLFLFIISLFKNTKPTPPPHKQTTNEKIKNAVQPTSAASKAPTQTLIYGTWTSQTSVIRAINITPDTAVTLATLPLNIKKVNVLSNKTLIYIDQTDQNDHGQRISVYDIQKNQIVINIPAASGFGIDDYVLSPNKRYLAIWEVQFSSDTNTLLGGQSRVYTVDLTRPEVSNLLYDEQTSEVTPTGDQPIAVHYPRAILDDGRVFFDQFMANDPNGGTGWAYGMSVADFDGTNKLDVTSMPNGTYGSQPSLSPDGKFLVFAGYDGKNGKGTTIIGGYRQALLTPNTVELLDTKSLQRFKLPNLPDTNTYSAVQWDQQTGNVILSSLSSDTSQMGLYMYNLSGLQPKLIPLPVANGTPYSFLTQLTAHKTLVGIQSNDAANLGNLGQSYSYSYTQLAILSDDGTLDYMSVEDPFAQYISILPGDYFSGVLAAETAKISPTTSPTQTQVPTPTVTGTSPQLYTFFLKTTLASLRIQGKSAPQNKNANPLMCQNLTQARCAALGLTPNSTTFTLCQNTQHENNLSEEACY